MAGANGNPPQIQHAVKLRIRFVDSLYRGKFLVAERLSSPVFLETQFPNLNVEAIWFSRIKVLFTRGYLPIMGSGTTETPWTDIDIDQAKRESHYAPSPIMQRQVTN